MKMHSDKKRHIRRITGIMEKPARRIPAVALALLLPCFGTAQAASSDTEAFDVTQLPIEQLLATEFTPASRIARQISDAPSAVSIVTAQDIRNYGYRSIADILQSMRGVFVNQGVVYDFLGGRGLGANGDFAGRIMLMIDGYATNENTSNQIFLREDSLLDVAMIERVEFIPGPGSTTYGNGAFLGVINIVTKHGRDFGGAQAAFESGPNHARKKRVTLGKRLDNGADVLASFSMYGDNGRDVRFAPMDGLNNLYGDPFTNQTLSHIRETDNRRMFLKGSYEGWSLEAANNRMNRRNDGLISYYYPSDMGKPFNDVEDSGFASLKYDADLGEQLKSSTHLYYGKYLFTSNYPSGPFGSFVEKMTGRWWGLDNKFVGTWFDRHQILFGAEFRNDYRQQYSDSWYTSGPGAGYDTGRRTFSLYAQDEYSLTDKLALTPGVRYDRNSVGGSATSPRLAAIYRPWQASTFKLSYGKAFRYANMWEQLTVDLDNFNAGNPPSTSPIKPEIITTTELVWQQQLASQARLTASLYKNHLADAIQKSYGSLDTIGQELGLEYAGESGFKLNTSIAHQKTTDNSGAWVANSPRWLGKFNVAQPLFQHRAMLGFEVQSIGSRQSLQPNSAVYGATATSTTVKGNTVANLTLSSGNILPDTNLSLSVRNLFDKKREEVIQSSILLTAPLEGRTLWLQLEYTLK